MSARTDTKMFPGFMTMLPGVPTTLGFVDQNAGKSSTVSCDLLPCR